MIWRDLLNDNTLTGLTPGGPPVTPHRLAEIEAFLALTLLPDLRALLTEMDGIYDTSGHYHLIMPAADILATNQLFRDNPAFRDAFQPFDSLLFFGQAGNGDLFAYPVPAHGEPGDTIIAWDHEDNRRRVVAPNLRTFIEDWVSGKIRL
jgi:hypothetical protein